MKVNLNDVADSWEWEEFMKYVAYPSYHRVDGQEGKSLGRVLFTGHGNYLWSM